MGVVRDASYMRNGILLCVPGFGTLDTEFVNNLFCEQKPIHTSIFRFFPINMEVAKARNAAVKLAMSQDCEYIYFRDHDTIVPLDALTILIARQLDVVGGLYYSKSKPPWPLMFVDGRPYLHHEHGALVKVEALGMGCTLIRTDVFRKLDPPWFKTANEAARVDALSVTNSSHTEDTFFCKRVREELGIYPHVDTGVVCAHKDLTTGTKYFYDPELAAPAWREPGGQCQSVLSADHEKCQVTDLTKESEKECEDTSGP